MLKKRSTEIATIFLTFVGMTLVGWPWSGSFMDGLLIGAGSAVGLTFVLILSNYIWVPFVFYKPAVKLVKSAPMTAKVGMFVIILNIIAGVFAPLISPYGETQIVGAEFLPWGQDHYLGTDNLGRDMFTRMNFGARNTIGIAFLTTALAFLLGSGTGLMAASVGGWVDQLLSRIVDVIMSIPTLIFGLMALTILGTAIPNVIGVIAVLYSAPVFRLARAVAMNVVVLDFVEAAKLRGEGIWWIVIREVLPNSLPPLVAEFGLRFCFVFLVLSALSFLGLGIQPPTADWGSMVRDNATLITYGDITPLLPAAAIAVLTIGVNFVVDWFLFKTSGLRDEH
jgi:peptide/nickel transport system permease protein